MRTKAHANTSDAAPPRAARVVSRLTRLGGVAVVLLAGALAVFPVVRAPYFGIHDCANVYRCIAAIDWSQPASFLNVTGDARHARPGEMLVYLPAVFSTSAAVHYCYLAVVVLGITVLLLFGLIRQITQRITLAVMGALTFLCSAPFIENYYTLGKEEPFMVAGALMVSAVLWRVLYGAAGLGRAAWYLVPAAAIGALWATTVKETAIVFPCCYVLGWGVATWGAALPVTQAVRRSWWLSLLVLCGACVLAWHLWHVPTFYDQGGTARYVLHTSNVLEGLRRLCAYYWITTPYVAPALVTGALALAAGWRRRMQPPQRTCVAWMLYWMIMWGGFAAVFAPWTDLQSRYMLPASGAAISMSMVAVAAGLWMARDAGRGMRYVVYALALVTLALMLAHNVFGVMIGYASEGVVRHSTDRAYDQMLRYIATATPQGGTAYFMYDAAHEESRYNTRFGMPLFYGRPDITCVFPRTRQDINCAGLVAVSTIAACYNPNRIATHAQACAAFYQTVAPSLLLRERRRFVYEVPVWYTSAQAYRGFQHASCWGLPAFWRLKRGTYSFGWIIYDYAPHGGAVNILQNGDFVYGLQHWGTWGAAAAKTNLVSNSPRCMRIENPDAGMPGIKQHVAVNMVSGAVYRLSGAARYVGRPNAANVMGARVTVWLPPQPEYDIVWLAQRDAWMRVERTFTNQVNGAAVVVAHLGYGHIAGTAEFADIRLERLP